MKNSYFRYKVHPGDLFRNTEFQKLPDSETETEDFLVWFLKDYSKDNRVAYINALYKLYHDEFQEESEKQKFIEYCELTSSSAIEEEISQQTEQLKKEAFENFYWLIRSGMIEVLEE